MKRIIILSVIIAGAFFGGIAARAADITEEETTPKYLSKTEEKAYKKTEVLREGKKYKTKVFISTGQGYDNNVFLDPRRKEDTFSEAVAEASVIYPLSGRWNVFGSLGVHDITYWEATDASLVDTDFKVGFDGKLFGNITLSALNNVELVEYPSYGDGSYLGDKTAITFKQKLPRNFFHSFGYEYFYKDFSDRKAHNGWGGMTETDRVDYRNTFDYEFGMYLKKMMLKLSSEYFVNDSNDKFHDYYDYQSIKLGASMIYLLTDKMSAYMAFIKQYKNFEHRTLPTDVTRREQDHGYTIISSLYYEMYKNTTIGLSYAYRQNHSNYAVQKYSGSVTTLGLYLRF